MGWGEHCNTESQLYYCQSRYYDPATGRFINSDSLVSTGQGLLGNNMFAYCGNNPISRSDPSGHIWKIVLIGIIYAIVFSGCSSGTGPYSRQANCYAYALKLENDPNTGEPFSSAPDPGVFGGADDLQKSELYASPEYVRTMIEGRIAKDAEALGLNLIKVDYPDKHEVAEGNWMIYVAYCPDPSIADYHFWRRDDDGTWSHKPGTGPIMYEDYSGNVISNPMFSDTGRYSEWIGYYEIGPN